VSKISQRFIDLRRAAIDCRSPVNPLAPFGQTSVQNRRNGDSPDLASEGWENTNLKERIHVVSHLRKYFAVLLLFTYNLWQHIFCVGERPMTNKAHISMRRLAGPELGCSSRRAWFLNYR